MTEPKEVTTIQQLAIGEEVRAGFRLFQHGLAELQAISAANDFYHPMLFMLSNGAERICKCVLAFRYLQTEGTFPSKNRFKKWGHNIKDMTDKIVENCYPPEVTARSAMQTDKNYLSDDNWLERVLDCLSAYATQGRYAELDMVAGASVQEASSPCDQWQRLELDITQDDPELKRAFEKELDPGAAADTYPQLNRRFVSILERYARALSRLFTLGPLHEEAKRHLYCFDHFLYLHDEDLGNTRYNDLLR